MTYFAIRATETWSLGTVVGALVLVAIAVVLVVRAVRVTADRYDR